MLFSFVLHKSVRLELIIYFFDRLKFNIVGAVFLYQSFLFTHSRSPPFPSIFLTSLSKSEVIFCVLLNASYSASAFFKAAWSGNAAFILQNIISAKSQKLIDICRKFFHRKCVFSLNQILDMIKISCYRSFKLPICFSSR